MLVPSSLTLDKCGDTPHPQSQHLCLQGTIFYLVQVCVCVCVCVCV